MYLMYLVKKKIYELSDIVNTLKLLKMYLDKIKIKIIIKHLSKIINFRKCN